ILVLLRTLSGHKEFMANVAEKAEKINAETAVSSNATDWTASAANTTVASTTRSSFRASALNIRIYASLCSLTTIALLAFASNLICDYDELAAGLISFFLGQFALTWYYVHGAALSRTRRAFFDEANVLNTYQIYNRKYGHLYEPEPPTPGFAALPFDASGVKTLGEAVRESAIDLNDERTKFDKAVQQHYGGMYENVLRVQRETNLPEQTAAANEDAGFSGAVEPVDMTGATGNGRLVSAEVPINGLGTQPRADRGRG
uniref:Uncharacterized protein n=1 Tax=Parascaris univalens TaxID=6257 RepID=A0A914ZV00_PARUN